MQERPAYFHHYMQENACRGRLVVQPRMGFSDRAAMRQGLQAVRELAVPVIGTITLDSFTRSGDFASASRAVSQGIPLNGYPLVHYSESENRELLAGLQGPTFPVQVRHGSPLPEAIFAATLRSGIDAIEGGPISYCLPYGRTPLSRTLPAWQSCYRMFAGASQTSLHIESFGGCMMGQLCPPALLIAITIAEGLLMVENGVRSYSLSLTQGTHTVQDIAALAALRQLGRKYLGPQEDWHIVFYTFMGKFPQSYYGSRAILEESVQAAVGGGAERLIVKTVKEAHQIPLITDNTDALQWASEAALSVRGLPSPPPEVTAWTTQITEEADFLLDLLLNLDTSLEKSIAQAFGKGYWDVPYCLHPDNRCLTRAQLDAAGFVYWSDAGRIPFTGHIRSNAVRPQAELSSATLLRMLSFNQLKYDGLPVSRVATPPGSLLTTAPVFSPVSPQF